MADPAAAKTRKALNQNHKKRGEIVVIMKPRTLCGVLFGEVKLGEADYTVIWETLLFMSNILYQISWKGPFDAYSLFKAFCWWKMRKTYTPQTFFCEYDKTRDLC